MLVDEMPKPAQPELSEWEQAAETLRIHEENDRLYGPLAAPEVVS